MAFLKVNRPAAVRLTAQVLIFCLFFAMTGCVCGARLKAFFLGERVRTVTVDGFTYTEYVPPSPLPKSGEKRALYIVFHPAGSSGEEFIQRWIPLVGKNENFLIAPTASGKVTYGTDKFENDLFNVISDFLKRYPIDENQLVLIGESNGAIAGCRLLENHPNRFRAAVLISGMIPDHFVKQVQEKGISIKSYLLVVHGMEDKLFHAQEIEKKVNALKDLGLQVELKTVEGMGHGSDPFAEDEIVQWLNGVKNSTI